jgi:hypothetical protein
MSFMIYPDNFEDKIGFTDIRSMFRPLQSERAARKSESGRILLPKEKAQK